MVESLAHSVVAEIFQRSLNFKVSAETICKSRSNTLRTSFISLQVASSNNLPTITKFDTMNHTVKNDAVCSMLHTKGSIAQFIEEQNAILRLFALFYFFLRREPFRNGNLHDFCARCNERNTGNIRLFHLCKAHVNETDTKFLGGLKDNT